MGYLKPVTIAPWWTGSSVVPRWPAERFCGTVAPAPPGLLRVRPEGEAGVFCPRFPPPWVVGMVDPSKLAVIRGLRGGVRGRTQPAPWTRS